MKKIFVLVLFLVLGKMWGYAQSGYPIQQFLGADSALVTSKGGLQGRLINWTYSDTAQANNQRIKAYPGAQIATINGGLNLWIRNATATAWIPVAIGSGNNIYTIDGTLLGNRELDGAGYDLRFNSLKEFGVGSDSIVFNSPKQRYFAGNQSFILQGDTASLSRRLSYTGNIGSTFTKYSLIDKNYVDSAIASSPAGTVTSIATNNATGITGGTITSTGTLAIDTTIISTKANVSGGLAGKLNISDTATMLQNYVNNVGYGLGKTSQSVYADSATLSAYYLRRKDSLTATNSLGYVTKTILADTAAAIRGASVSGFVPYVGATQNVNLGQFGLKTEYAEFDTTLRAVTSRTLQWSNADGTLQFGMTNGGTITQNIGLQQFARVRNLQGSQITKGQVVYISGASGDRASVKLADNRDDSTSSKTLGVAAENIANGDVGFVGTFGTITNLNLSAFNPGDIVYLDSVPGQLTNVKPQAPYNLVFIGVVERANSGNGLLFVNPQNGYELEELHNVKITKPVRNNAILVYDSTGKVWVDTTISQAGLAVTNIATNASTGILGGSITTTGTISADTLLLSTRAWRQKGVDSVISVMGSRVNGTTNYVSKFTGTNTIGNSQIFDNGTNVGVGTTSPTQKLDVNGDASINGVRVGKGASSGSNNVVVGDNAFITSGTGSANTAVGSNALTSNTVHGNNVAIGFYSLNLATANDNTAVGASSLRSTTTGGQNTAIGYYTGYKNTTGTLNSSLGFAALQENQTSSNNTAIGSYSLNYTTAANNTAVGYASLFRNTTGTNNTAIGANAGTSIAGGGNNQTSTNSLYLGDNTRAGASGNTNEIVIGSSAEGSGSNTVTLGNGSITKTILRANVGVGTTAPDSALTVVNGAYFQRGVRASGLPSAPGTKALRIDASGTISYADTLVDAGGTVTSVATNTATGITGGTITTSGTLAIDTTLISTRLWRQKGIDSVTTLLNNNILGTTNYIPKFTATNKIGNSVMYETGSNIGVGTTSPNYKLQVDGLVASNTYLSLNAGGYGWGTLGGGSVGTIIEGSDASPNQFIKLKVNSSDALTVNANQETLINTTVDAGDYKLQAVASPTGTAIYASGTTAIYANGNVGIGTATPDSMLTVAQGARFLRGVRMSGLAQAAGTKALRIDASGTLSIADTLANGISGTGTTNYIPKFTSSSAIGNSNLQTDASGNLGLGVTPSAFSGVVGLQLPSFGVIAYSSSGHLTSNAYFNSGWKYITGAGAAMYNHSGNEHQWQVAPVGTAGNAISFTQAMTLNASGNLLVGGTSDNGSRLQVTGAATFSSSVTAGGNITASYAGPSRMIVESTTNSNNAGIYFAVKNSSGIGLQGGVYYIPTATPYLTLSGDNSGTHLNVTQAGNVGIGTTSPDRALTVNGQIGLNNDLVSTKGGQVFRIGYEAYTLTGGVNMFTEGSIPLVLGTNSTERMRITSGGNVGIGTTSPNIGTWNQALTLNTASGNAAYELAVGGSAQLYLAADNSNAYLQVANTTSPLRVFTGGSERMRITSGGNVLVGRTTNAAAGWQMAIQNGLTVTDGTYEVQLFGYFGAGVGTYTNHDFTIRTNNTERMRITSSGEILVNTTTDAGAYYLQVNGDVYANGYYESSDRRLKDILSVREGSYGINTVTFKWKDQRDSLTHVGYLAQDVEKVLPDAVKNNPNGYKTINYDEVQSFKIAALEQEVAELKEMIKKLLK